MISPKVNSIGLPERGLEPSGGGFSHLCGVIKAIEIVSKKEYSVGWKLSNPPVRRGEMIVNIWNDERAHDYAL